MIFSPLTYKTKKKHIKTINKIYVNGEFVTPHGTEVFDLINPSTNELAGKVILGDEEDTRRAIAAAKAALLALSATTKEERISYLERLRAAVSKREEDMAAAIVEEYGGTLQKEALCMRRSELLSSLLNKYLCASTRSHQ